MAILTVTHPYISNFGGVVAKAQFTNGTASVDDATDLGKAQKAFFIRHGWAITGTPADLPTLNEGKPLSAWTDPELKAYLDEWHVGYPSGASSADLRAAVQTAFETRAQGGSAALAAAGHTQGTFPVEGAPIVPGDDADKAAVWETPQIGTVSNDVAPVITVQPSASPKVAPATATYTVAATGTPTPSIQWERQAKGVGDWLTIDPEVEPTADDLSYTTPPLSVAENNGDKYRARVSNSDGVVYSTVVTQVVS